MTKVLCAEILTSCGLYQTHEKAEQAVAAALSSGRALEKFAQMVCMLGGPADFAEKPAFYLPHAQISRPVFAQERGYVESMSTRDIGMLLVGLRGGRTHPDQKLDYATGFSSFCQIGDYVDEHTPLAYVHAQNEEEFNEAAYELKRLIKIGAEKISTPVVLCEVR